MLAPWENSDWNDRSGLEYCCFVGNLLYGVSESSLKDAFSSYRPLYSEIAWDNDTGRSRGFGFVQFEDKASMDNTIQGTNSQQEVGGRNVTVSQANSRPRRWRA